MYSRKTKIKKKIINTITFILLSTAFKFSFLAWLCTLKEARSVKQASPKTP